MKFKYAGYIPNSLQNGDGIRDVVFFSGCKHECRGCHNPELWDPNFGEDIEIEDIVNLVKKNQSLIDGVTISGGDPFFQYDALLCLCKRLKEEGFNIWVYTGYYLVDLQRKMMDDIFQYIDVLVDGPYLQDLPPVKYRGSSNQRLIHFEKGTVKEIRFDTGGFEIGGKKQNSEDREG